MVRLSNLSKRGLGFVPVLALAAAGCVMTDPQEAAVVARPKTQPVRNFTSFSRSLECMDDLFASFGVRDVVITSQGIPDATGEIRTGTKEMLISAVSRMSMNSGAFTFVDFDQTQVDVNALQNLVGFTDTFVVPNYYLRGAITQLDEQVVAESVSGGISIAQADAGASVDQVISIVSVDLNVGDLLSRQIIPGTSANNSVAVRRAGQSADAGGTISKPELGLNFNISLNRSEGMHQAVRTLVELSTIEALGKLAQVPYWRCLQIEQTNPAVTAEARKWYGRMTPRERVVFVQRALDGLGLYDGPIDGALNPATREAIGVYQARNDLIADGRLSFDLYASMISGDLALGRPPDPEQTPERYVPAATAPRQLLSLTLTTPRGAAPRYRVGDRLELVLSSNADAFAYCYYRDGRGAIARVFPNRFQPDALIPGGATIQIPGPTARFEIVLENPGAEEEVACVASDVELGSRLPDALRAEDLTPLPVDSLDQVANAFGGVAGASVVKARMPIKVTR